MDLSKPKICFWVFIGGMLGAAARIGTGAIIPVYDSIHHTHLVYALINIVGAFGLGYLYEHISYKDAKHKVYQRIKPCFGTGFFGGFTSYGTFVLLIDKPYLLGSTPDIFNIAYGPVCIILGFLGAALGIWLAGIVNADTKEEIAQEELNEACEQIDELGDTYDK